MKVADFATLLSYCYCDQLMHHNDLMKTLLLYSKYKNVLVENQFIWMKCFTMWPPAPAAAALNAAAAAALFAP